MRNAIAQGRGKCGQIVGQLSRQEHQDGAEFDSGLELDTRLEAIRWLGPTQQGYVPTTDRIQMRQQLVVESAAWMFVLLESPQFRGYDMEIRTYFHVKQSNGEDR